MNSEQSALLDAIRAFKPDEQSDLEAALNLVLSHAETIKQAQNTINRLHSVLDMIALSANERKVLKF